MIRSKKIGKKNQSHCEKNLIVTLISPTDFVIFNYMGNGFNSCTCFPSNNMIWHSST